MCSSSSAAAQVLEMMTGDPFFPGGMAEFIAEQNNFLVFETGPSVDVVLQWATYRDASDQTSLSRIWGGIHPPIDDIPGRFMGIEVGTDAFNLAEELFNGEALFCAEQVEMSAVVPMPIGNPVRQGETLNFSLNCSETDQFTVFAYDVMGRVMGKASVVGQRGSLPTQDWPVGVYFLRLAEGGKGSVGVVQVY